MNRLGGISVWGCFCDRVSVCRMVVFCMCSKMKMRRKEK